MSAGGVIRDHTPNYSLARPRAPGVGNSIKTGPGINGIGSEPWEYKHYMQPGYPLNKINKHPALDKGKVS